MLDQWLMLINARSKNLHSQCVTKIQLSRVLPMARFNQGITCILCGIDTNLIRHWSLIQHVLWYAMAFHPGDLTGWNGLALGVTMFQSKLMMILLSRDTGYYGIICTTIDKIKIAFCVIVTYYDHSSHNGILPAVMLIVQHHAFLDLT